MKKIVFFACMMASAMMANAQEVDKEKVQTQAEAAAEAKKALKEVDTGDKIWKFSGDPVVRNLPASAGAWVRFLFCEDSTFVGATKPGSHSY